MSKKNRTKTTTQVTMNNVNTKVKPAVNKSETKHNNQDALKNTTVKTGGGQIDIIHNEIHEAPDINRVNEIIRDYNGIIKEVIEFDTVPKLLDRVLRLPQYELKDFLYSILLGFGYDVVYEDGYLYGKGDIPIMLCAHMDTVHKDPVKTIWVSNTGRIWSPQGIGGDDRCGIYTILMNLTKEKKPYILFTEDEEIGCIGAQRFADDVELGTIDRDDIDIHMIIEIDRKNANDSVYYDCDNEEFEEYINKFGFKTAWGSCSDISYVAPALGIAAVNLSSGYYDQHTLEETIDIADLYDTIRRVRKIVEDVRTNETKSYEYIERKYSYNYHGSYRYSGWYDDVDETYDYTSQKYDDYGYSPYGNYNTNIRMTGESLYDEHEVSIYNFDIASPVMFSAGDYIIMSDGTMISDAEDFDYFINEKFQLYVATDWIEVNETKDEGYVVEPVNGVAYSSSGLPLRMSQMRAHYVYFTM